MCAAPKHFQTTGLYIKKSYFYYHKKQSQLHNNSQIRMNVKYLLREKEIFFIKNNKYNFLIQ